MSETAEKEIQLPFDAEFDLPEEIQDNPYSPLKDKYLQQIRSLRAQIALHASKMKVRNVDFVKLRFQDLTCVEIAKKHNCRAELVERVLRSEECKRLRYLMMLLKLTEDGATEKQRLNMLWRIATDNEQERPKTAIAAIEAMNKLLGKGGNGGNVFQVIVQNQVLGAGPLDGD